MQRRLQAEAGRRLQRGRPWAAGARERAKLLAPHPCRPRGPAQHAAGRETSRRGQPLRQAAPEPTQGWRTRPRPQQRRAGPWGLTSWADGAAQDRPAWPAEGSARREQGDAWRAQQV